MSDKTFINIITLSSICLLCLKVPSVRYSAIIMSDGHYIFLAAAVTVNYIYSFSLTQHPYPNTWTAADFTSLFWHSGFQSDGDQQESRTHNLSTFYISFHFLKQCYPQRTITKVTNQSLYLLGCLTCNLN